MGKFKIKVYFPIFIPYLLNFSLIDIIDLLLPHLGPEWLVCETVVDSWRRQIYLVPRVDTRRRHSCAHLILHLVEAGLDGIVELIIREGGVGPLLKTKGNIQ